MNEKTLEFCLSLLDTHRNYIKFEKKSGKVKIINTLENQRQDAYYHGMCDTLNAVLTEAFTKCGGVIFSHWSGHTAQVEDDNAELTTKSISSVITLR